MTYLMSIFLGFVQGVAEFLPISSSGHLSIFQNFFGMDNPEEGHLFFDILLHLATLVSVCIFYRREIAEICREIPGFVLSLAGRGGEKGIVPARRLLLLIIIATLPLVAVLFVNDYIELLYYNTGFIGFALLVTGCLLYISDKVTVGDKTERTATLKDALLVGIAQAIAVIPGLSRSGTTITSGILCGFDQSFAVKFSFLLSLPAILGANIFNLVDVAGEGVELSLLPVYLVGMLVASVVGYFAIGLVKRLTEKSKLKIFSYYCWGMGVLTIILSIVL